MYQIHQQEKIITESSVLESANADYKEVIRPLRAGSVSIDMWIRHTAEVRPHLPGMTLIEEAATRGLEMTQIFECFNCGEQGGLRIN